MHAIHRRPRPRAGNAGPFGTWMLCRQSRIAFGLCHCGQGGCVNGRGTWDSRYTRRSHLALLFARIQNPEICRKPVSFQTVSCAKRRVSDRGPSALTA